MNNKSLFDGKDFDDADHISEIRYRPLDTMYGVMIQPPQETVKISTLDLTPTEAEAAYDKVAEVAGWPTLDNIQERLETIPNGLRITATGRIVNDRMELLGKALEQQRSLLTRPIASVAKCDHDWPEDDRGTDMEGSCTKCGMSFMLYIHVECP